MATISFIALAVVDIEAAADFYSKVFDLKSPDRLTGFVALETGATKLGLYPWDELAHDAGVSASRADGFRGITLCHNVASREGVDEIFSRACQADGTSVKSPTDTSWGGYSGYFADPDGHLWEVTWNPNYPLESGV